MSKSLILSLWDLGRWRGPYFRPLGTSPPPRERLTEAPGGTGPSNHPRRFLGWVRKAPALGPSAAVFSTPSVVFELLIDIRDYCVFTAGVWTQVEKSKSERRGEPLGHRAASPQGRGCVCAPGTRQVRRTLTVWGKDGRSQNPRASGSVLLAVRPALDSPAGPLCSRYSRWFCAARPTQAWLFQLRPHKFFQTNPFLPTAPPEIEIPAAL